MKKNLLLILGAVIVIAGIIVIAPDRQTPNPAITPTPAPSASPLSGLNSVTGNSFSNMATSSRITVTTSSTDILASSTPRQYAAIVNDGSNVVYLNFNGATAVANSGLRLNANGGTFEITSENLYKGQITAIASGGSSVVTVVEK